MSTKDSSKTGDSWADRASAEVREKIEQELIFRNNTRLGEYASEGKGGGFTDPKNFERVGELKLPIKEMTRRLQEETGIKEKDGKITYNEIDWDFIDDMSNRMDQNTKYPPLNYQKGMDVVELAKAVIRHARKIIQPIPGDEETVKDHIEAIGTNAMMMNYQVKKKVK